MRCQSTNTKQLCGAESLPKTFSFGKEIPAFSELRVLRKSPPLNLILKHFNLIDSDTAFVKFLLILTCCLRRKSPTCFSASGIFISNFLYAFLLISTCTNFRLSLFNHSSYFTWSSLSNYLYPVTSCILGSSVLPYSLFSVALSLFPYEYYAKLQNLTKR